ncbi:sugar ABC transporter permease [Nonomuraea sp. NPDC004580]|uniref:sugar ABC transporter permease n=1 Tax=Nonomuraea sp. NPDC004580 TaxID=3154552 RepID=UPI0033AC402E
MTSPNPQGSGTRLVGLLLAVPALVGALITLVLPTAQTIWLSFQSGGVLRKSAYAGTENYAELLGDDASWRALGFTVSLVGFPLLVALVVGPLLALALHRAGPWPRRAGRVLLSLAVVTFSPVAVAASWLRGLMPEESGLVALAEGLRDPATAPGTLRLVVAAATFGLVCALAVIAFLPALRGHTPGPATVVVGVLVAFAVVAAGLQTFALSQVLTGGGPQRATQTLAGLQYDYAFRTAEFGLGAAVATLTGAVLGVLGIAATIIAAASGLRITLTPKTDLTDPRTPPTFAPGDAPARHGPPASCSRGALTYGAQGQTAFGRQGPAAFGTQGSAALGPAGASGTGGAHGSQSPSGRAQESAPAAHPGGAGGVTSPYLPGSGQPEKARQAPARRAATPAGAAIGIAALAVVVVAAFMLAWPWMDGVLASRAGAASSLRAQVNTWVPAVVGALVSVGVAYLAALGIGGLRPLGRASEWLLLIFAPWLFVGAGPFSVANWQNVRNLGLIDTFPALIPPLLVSVPALLVLTLLCKGLAERTDRDFYSGVFLPSLPMAGILAGAVTLVNAHDVQWPLLVVQHTDLFTAPVAQMAQVGGFSRAAADVGAATPLAVVAVALAVLVTAQLLYLDRLAITTKDSRVRTPVS